MLRAGGLCAPVWVMCPYGETAAMLRAGGLWLQFGSCVPMVRQLDIADSIGSMATGAVVRGTVAVKHLVFELCVQISLRHLFLVVIIALGGTFYGIVPLPIVLSLCSHMVVRTQNIFIQCFLCLYSPESDPVVLSQMTAMLRAGGHCSLVRGIVPYGDTGRWCELALWRLGQLRAAAWL